MTQGNPAAGASPGVLPGEGTGGHTLPAVHLLYLLELVKRWGITDEQLLAGSGVDVAAVSKPSAPIPLDTVLLLLERARSLTGEPALGYYLGLQLRVAAHGELGVAALSAATVREALDLVIRLAPIVTTAVSLRLEVEGGKASLIFEEKADFGAARETFLLAAIIAIWQAGLAISGREMSGYADLALPEPEDYDKIRLVSQGRLRFNQPVHRLLFDAAVLDAKLTMADPVALRLAREQCERILASRGPGAKLTQRVRSLVIHARGQPLPLERVAQVVGLSPRSLKRKLAAEGTQYSAIVEEERREQALLLLREPGASIKDVANRLGYANVGNFTRAFHRWTGSTPAEHRSAADVTHAGGEK
jgi:AraC-like DNA-binding protein